MGYPRLPKTAKSLEMNEVLKTRKTIPQSIEENDNLVLGKA